MLGDFFGRGASRAPNPAPEALPAELVLAIERARVTASPRPDAEGNPIVRVNVAVIGEWRWDGVAGAEERIERVYPEINPTGRRRAARLIEAAVGEAALRAIRVQPPARAAWVWDW